MTMVAGKDALISVIIVNYNGRKWLKDCLDSIYSQNYKNFEVILVDNASNDGSADWVENNYPKVNVVKNTINGGFAQGNNLGYKKSKGEYMLLLNNDATIEPDFLKKMLPAFDEIPNLGSVQPKIIKSGTNLIDHAGIYWMDFALMYYYGDLKNANLDKYNKTMPFFSNIGACMLIKRGAIEKVGLFDEDFWCYNEEVDFCYRLWSAGYECWYYPTAVCYHAGSMTSKKFDESHIIYQDIKNRIMLLIKNMEFTNLSINLAGYLSIYAIINIIWLFQMKFKKIYAYLSALAWNITNLQKNLQKRANIQKIRTKKDSELFTKIKRNPRLSYSYYLFRMERDKYVD